MSIQSALLYVKVGFIGWAEVSPGQMCSPYSQQDICCCPILCNEIFHSNELAMTHESSSHE